MCASPNEIGSSGTDRRLKYATLLNSLFVLLEFTAGMLSGSLALVTDAFHNAVDSLTLGFSWLATRWALRPADRLRTYGYHRATVLIALLNAFVLVGVMAGIAYNAVDRFARPVPIEGGIVVVTGLLGVLCNLCVVLILKRSRKQLHVAGAYAHNLADALSSALIVVSGTVIYFTQAYWVDLALSLAICVMLARSILPIIGRSVHILLEGAPDGADRDKITERILSLPEAVDVHDLHTWLQRDGMAAITCHVVLKPDVHHEHDHEVVDRIRTMLRVEFELTHSTIQVEHKSCEQAAGCRWDEASSE